MVAMTLKSLMMGVYGGKSSFDGGSSPARGISPGGGTGGGDMGAIGTR